MYQVQVIDGGLETFNALVYGQKHPGTLRYIQSQFNNFTDKLTDAGRSFFSNVEQIYDQFNGSDALRIARDAINKVKMSFTPNEIISLWDLASIQTAGTVMQRWIMAEPTVRSLFHQQKCDGFSDSYIDMQPKAVGEDHYDYRRVMNGMLVFSEEHDWIATNYFDELHDNDRELTFDEQIDIQSVWSLMQHAVSVGNDPTNPLGGKL